MNRISFGFRALICAALLTAVAAIAQVSDGIPPAPIPQAIRAAKAIFVSNVGADSVPFPYPFSGYPERGYNQFYAGLKAAGQWELVSEPSDADLVLELHLIDPDGPARVLFMFRLVIYDRKSRYVLWVLNRPVEAANQQANRDRNFDKALTALLSDFQELTGELPTKQATQKRQ